MIESEIIPGGLVCGEVEHQKTKPVPYPNHLFKLHTLASFVGARGKGKTNLVSLLSKEHIDKGYFTRVYVISPTFASNEVLHVLPLRPEDIYLNYHDAGVALDEIIEKVSAEHRIYKHEKLYRETHESCMKQKRLGLSYKEVDKNKREYMEAMQRHIHSMYAALQERLENMMVQAPADIYMAEHAKLPKDSKDYGKLYQAKRQKIEEVKDDTLKEANREEEKDEENEKWPDFYPPFKMKKPSPLIIIDDMSHSDIYSTSRSNPLVNLSLRHRHIGGPGCGVSIYFLVQTFKTGVPKALRFNCQQFFIFKGSDESVLDRLDFVYECYMRYCNEPRNTSMYEEFAGIASRDEFFSLYHHAVGEDPQSHDFLTVDLNARNNQWIFRKNLNELLKIKSKAKDLDSNAMTLQDKKDYFAQQQEVNTPSYNSSSL